MKNKTPLRRFCGAVLSLLLLASIAALPATAASTESIIDDTISHLYATDGSPEAWVSGTLADGAGSSSEWYILSLCGYKGAPELSTYADALEAKMNAGVPVGAVERQRCALTLIACGRGDSSAVSSVADDTIGKQGIMSLIFGLHLLNNGAISSEYTTAELIDELLSSRLADGGWALIGERFDADVTAMAVQALAPHVDNAEVSSAVNSALERLSLCQLDSGAYLSYGVENPETTAQVLTALTSLGIDPRTDERFIKNGNTTVDAILGFRLADGGFCHEHGKGENVSSTVQALYSLISLWRLESGLGPFYIFNSDTDAEISFSETFPVSSDTFFHIITSAAPDSDAFNTPDTPDTAEAPAPEAKHGYKLYICLGTAAALVAFLVILAISKKLNLKNALFALAVSGLVVILVLSLNICLPGDYYGRTDTSGNSIGTVTLSLRCDNAVAAGAERENGVILDATSIDLYDGDSVYDLLIRAAAELTISVDHSGSGGMEYIRAIDGLYEYDFGELSGWMYRVNGQAPSVGCGSYILSDGDTVEWIYTCALGEDIE